MPKRHPIVSYSRLFLAQRVRKVIEWLDTIPDHVQKVRVCSLDRITKNRDEFDIWHTVQYSFDGAHTVLQVQSGRLTDGGFTGDILEQRAVILIASNRATVHRFLVTRPT